MSRFIIAHTLNGRTTYVNGRSRATATEAARPRASAKTAADATTYSAKQAAKFAAELGAWVGHDSVTVIPAP